MDKEFLQVALTPCVFQPFTKETDLFYYYQHPKTGKLMNTVRSALWTDDKCLRESKGLAILSWNATPKTLQWLGGQEAIRDEMQRREWEFCAQDLKQYRPRGYLQNQKQVAKPNARSGGVVEVRDPVQHIQAAPQQGLPAQEGQHQNEEQHAVQRQAEGYKSRKRK